MAPSAYRGADLLRNDHWPGRHPLNVSDRLAEIYSRYESKHLASRAITAPTPCILTAVRAVEAALNVRA